MKIDYPGIGGSLGECCVCGQSFCAELMLGKSVKMGRIDGFDRDVPLHDKCFDILVHISSTTKDWRELPDGPLKQEFAEANEVQP